MRIAPIVLIAFVALSLIPGHVHADTAAATKYVAEATELVAKGSQFFEDATAKLELAEASLDDVPAAEQPALKAKIDAVKKQIQTAKGSDDKIRIERRLKGLISDVEGAVGNLVVWPGKSAELTELLNDPKTTEALGEPAVAAYKKQFATMAKVHQGKALTENLGNAKTRVDELEKDWAANKAKLTATGASDYDRNNAAESTARDLEQIERFFKDLPADNGDVKALRTRVEKVKTEQAAAVGAAGATSQVERINRSLERDKGDYEGMASETTEPTWAEYKTGNADAREFNAPKTIAFVRSTESLLENLEKEENYQATKNDPKVKAIIDDLKAKTAAARKKLAKSAAKLVDELEKEKINKNNENDAGGLALTIGRILGSEDAEAKPLIERVTKLQKEFADAGAKADNDQAAYYKSMTEQANKAWPAMASKFEVTEGFDPNNASAMKGKYIKIVTNNLMGWSFKPGDFPFATKLNGVAIAGKYDPVVKAALAEVEAKLGRAIGDNDSDGEWTVIAHVDGGTGKLVQFVEQSGDVTVDGTKVGTVKGRDERPVDAPIVTIVALKAGPVAVAQGQGAVTESGTIATVPGAATSGGGISFFGILTGLVGLLVGAACLMKAKFAPLAGNANAVQLTEKVGGQNIAYLGLAGIALGAIGVLLNLVALPSAFFHAIFGIVTSLAMIIAGGVASRDFLASKGALPANVSPILTQYALPAGLICAVLGALTFITSIF